MPRAILRWSINGESSNRTGVAINNVLRDADVDLTVIGTAAREIYHSDLLVVLNVLHQIMEVVGQPPGRGRLDHLWIYLDHTNE